MKRPPCIHHCTSEPLEFFGREAELAVLDRALAGAYPSVTAFVGPGGQGKTAIMQTWLERIHRSQTPADGVFFWSFYRGKDADLCLRELLRYAENLQGVPDVSAGYCVDRLLELWRAERWAVVLDGTEVVQHESGSWHGRFVHPELGRLLEEIAAEPIPGVVVLTTRFPLPTLATRSHARILSLSSLDAQDAVSLLRSFEVKGDEIALREAAARCGFHAKAVELLGTYLREFERGDVKQADALFAQPIPDGESPDEGKGVALILSAFQRRLAAETKDILALATAFRQPPGEKHLRQYLLSEPVRNMLAKTWQRSYSPFAERLPDWLGRQFDKLVELRLLERVHGGVAMTGKVIDAHPLVRRGFESVLGREGRRQQSQARAGFLRERPDRKPPERLEEAREEVELFHAYCEAGLWEEADAVYAALDNPKHRFLAPAFERDLLLQFFPNQDWRRPPRWPEFARFRSLAICSELLGHFDEAMQIYPSEDGPLRGDALIAIGRLQPLLDRPQVAPPWQNLWQAYRAHALCLAGRAPEGVALAKSLVPVDVYEWVHVFECLLRAGQLHALDLDSVLYRPPYSAEHRWSRLARARMRLDYLRITETESDGLAEEYQELIEEYDRGGLPYERSLARLSYARVLLRGNRRDEAEAVLRVVLETAKRYGMRIMTADGLALNSELQAIRRTSRDDGQRIRQAIDYLGPLRP